MHSAAKQMQPETADANTKVKPERMGMHQVCSTTEARKSRHEQGHEAGDANVCFFSQQRGDEVFSPWVRERSLEWVPKRIPV